MRRRSSNATSLDRIHIGLKCQRQPASLNAKDLDAVGDGDAVMRLTSEEFRVAMWGSVGAGWLPSHKIKPLSHLVIVLRLTTDTCD